MERQALAGLMHHPNIIAIKSDVLNEDLFHDKDDVHKIIFRVVCQFFKESKSLDPILIANAIKTFGVSFGNMTHEDMCEYVKNLSFSKIPEKTAIETIDQLNIYRVRRELWKKGEKLKKYVRDTTSDNIDQVLSECNRIYTEDIHLFSAENQPEDITNDLVELIKERLKNPVDEMGLKTPFDNFNKQFGGLRCGDVYAFVSRPKHGKTTFLSWLAMEVARINNCKVLYLDTEMKTEDLKFRNLSAYSGISMWDLETGNITDEDKKKLWKALQQYENDLKDKFYHIQCPMKSTEQVVNIVKRWILKHIGENEKFLIVYDYIKLTGEKTSQHKQEYQLIGEKVNRLKELSSQFNFPLLTAAQLNRDAENGRDDSGAIASSDRLQWFASFVAIFRKRRPEEYERYGDKDNCGTHALIPLATRFQGRHGKGHSLETEMPSGNSTEVVPYFINYSIDNFKVSEKCSSDDIAEELNLRDAYDESAEYESEDPAYGAI